MSRAALWALAALAVVAMVVAEVTRPLAPGVTAVDVATFLDVTTVTRATAYRGPLRFAALLSLALRVGTAVLIARMIAVRVPRSPSPGGPSAAEGVGRSRWWSLRLGLLGAGLWAATDVVRLPLQLWAWRRAVAVGLSTQELGSWLTDLAIQDLPYWLGVGAVVAGVVAARRRWPRRWVPVVGLVGGVLGVVLIVVSPLLFEPLLFDLRPLPDGPLRRDIVDLIAVGGLDPDTPVLVADASRRTTASNAYVSGIGGTRRIVLYDTLLADASEPEILTILAHELGHAANRDVERTAVQLVGVAVLLAACVAVLAGRGVVDPDGQVSRAGAARMVAVAIILLVVLTPVERWSSRRTESAADAAALHLTGDAATYERMMQGLATRNLSDPDPPFWNVVLFFSHPPVGERYARARTS